jgi:probable HAF family extracellular repeat protein
MRDLNTLGGDASFAMGINRYGQVVGYSKLSDNNTDHAFIWSETTGMQDLNDLTPGLPEGVFLEIALAINDRGQIVGYTSPNHHAFLLTPSSPPGPPPLSQLLLLLMN